MEHTKDIDVDRVVEVLRRRVFKPGERVTKVAPMQPWLTVDTDKRRLRVSRQPWAILDEPWVVDALLVQWQSSGSFHGDDLIYGLVFTDDGGEHLLCADGDDDLAALGPRVPAGMDPLAYAELVALFHTSWFVTGELIRDPAEFVARYPKAASTPSLRPPEWRRADGSTTISFLASERRVGESEGYLVVRDWTVVAPVDGPATWSNRELAQIPFL